MTAQSDQPAAPVTKVVQITNIAPQATKDQMQSLLAYLGKIEDIRLYPTIRDVSVPVQSRICFVKFFDGVCVGPAQHMTNTVFIDRALIVTPYISSSNEIPDEYRALEIAAQANVVPGLYGNNSKLPPHVTNQIEGVQPNQVITTHDPALVSSNLPPYPPLPINLDSVRIEEIRRTLLISNLDPTVTAQLLIDFFGKAGDVKYVRFCKMESESGINYALIEFSEQTSIINALKLNGVELGGKQITVGHSTVNIDKPQAKSNEAAQREIEEAMTRVKEAQNLISAAIDPVIGILSKDKKRGRSRSRSRRRSRSRSRGRRRRSRSRSRGRRRRSRSRKRSRSRSRKRTRSRDRKKRSRDRRRSKSRSRSKSRGSRRRSRSHSKSKKSEKSKSGGKPSKEEKHKEKDKDKEKKTKDVSPPVAVVAKRDRREESQEKSTKKDKEKSVEREKSAKPEKSSKQEKSVKPEKIVEQEKSVEREKPPPVVDSATDNSASKDSSKSPEKDSASPVVQRSRSRSASRKLTPPPATKKKSRSESTKKKSRSPSRKKSRSPSRRKSRSPSSRKKSRSPSRKKSVSRSVSRKKSRSPRRRTRSPRRRTRSRSRRKSRSPVRRRSRSAPRKRSRSPRRKNVNSGVKYRSRSPSSPARRRTKSPSSP